MAGAGQQHLVKPRQLGADFFRYNRMAMPMDNAPPGGNGIEIPPALLVEEVNPLCPVDEEQVLKFKTVVFLEMAPGPNDF